MDDDTSFNAGSPLHSHIRAVAVATRLMAERLTTSIPLQDVVAELPDLDGPTISTLLAMGESDLRVRYPNLEDLEDAIVYAAIDRRSLAI